MKHYPDGISQSRIVVVLQCDAHSCPKLKFGYRFISSLQENQRHLNGSEIVNF